MPAILKVDEAKQMHDHAIEFERKLIATWLKNVLPEKELLVLKTGMYKSQLACKVYAQGNTRPTPVAADGCTVTCPWCGSRHQSDELCYECFPS